MTEIRGRFDMCVCVFLLHRNVPGKKGEIEEEAKFP